ncbi:MAG: sigma-70 family RNA polymerase sigma factor [Ignavibacteriota bacterium]|nr:sigma-70 family RNA polymerase sigma factor [Ignavibacterium album]NOG67686.1 sigma-70 family RNA polymerase sigma factor [Chlorobiota bacterium]QKK00685.1 MAG: sigma-70 family RNA polymerase sigma factor [Ignavibacteriota bacterium]HOJ06205.1 sigma-70 family RNA polymerase sigma factor [Ignavibacteriaceae bacterium]
MTTELNDIELFKRILNKDSKALEALYDRYSPVLFTFIKRIVNDTAIADGVLADVFVIIWQKTSKLNFEHHNPYAVLINLCRNKALDTLRRAQNIELPEYTGDFEDEFILPKLSIHTPQNDLSKILLNREKIQFAIHSLTEAQQYVISLAYYDSLTESDIAAKLNIPLLTVKSKIRVALNSIKENLAKEGIQ